MNYFCTFGIGANGLIFLILSKQKKIKKLIMFLNSVNSTIDTPYLEIFLKVSDVRQPQID